MARRSRQLAKRREEREGWEGWEGGMGMWASAHGTAGAARGAARLPKCPGTVSLSAVFGQSLVTAPRGRGAPRAVARLLLLLLLLARTGRKTRARAAHRLGGSSPKAVPSAHRRPAGGRACSRRGAGQPRAQEQCQQRGAGEGEGEVGDVRAA